MPLPHCYDHCLYVPCYCRQQVVDTIDAWKLAAFEEDGKDSNPLFVTNETLTYEIKFTHGDRRSKFHGPGWKKLIDDYDLCYGDFITVNLLGEDLRHIDVSLMLKESCGGHVPLPKPGVPLSGALLEREHTSMRLLILVA